MDLVDTNSTSSASDRADPPEALRPDPLPSNRSSWESTTYLHTFLRIQIARSACGQRLQEPFADAVLQRHSLRRQVRRLDHDRSQSPQ